MGRGTRYIVQTRYGTFSLDEGSYRDYLAGRSWIDWPPREGAVQQAAALPQGVSGEALALCVRAAEQGAWTLLEAFPTKCSACVQRLCARSVSELKVSARALNALLRAGVESFGQLQVLLASPRGLLDVRDLGPKGAREIERVFFETCYAQLLPDERAEFWQTLLDAN